MNPVRPFLGMGDSNKKCIVIDSELIYNARFLGGGLTG